MTDSDTPRSLDDTITARAEALATKARRSGGRLDAEDLAEVQALAHLQQLQQVAALQRPSPAAARWPIALTLLAALAVASALMALRVTSTPIELEAEATVLRVELGAARPQPVTGTLALTGLRAVGVTGDEAGPAGQPTVLTARASSDAACQASLTLEPLLLPAGAQLTLRASARPERLRLSVLAPGAALRLSQAACPGEGQPRQTRSLVLTLGAEEADLELEAATAPLALAQVMAVQRLALDEIETLADSDATHVRRVSSLRSGQLHRLAMEGGPLALRRGELLSLGSAGGEGRLQGELREVEAGAGAVKLRFVGEVRSLSRGEAPHARNLMPTWLQWLRANQAFALVWGSGLTLFGLAAALGRWWRRK